KLPGVGKPYDNLAHQPGANAGGSNFVTTADSVYVLLGKTCVRLDVTTGEKLAEFKLSPLPGETDAPTWSFVSVCGDYLIGGSNPTKDTSSLTRSLKSSVLSSSLRLTVLHRLEGRELWSAMSENGFRNNAICAGGGRLFAIDRPSSDYLAYLQRRGDEDKVT